ncbi:hypothetical protein ABLU29_07010 [Lactococcus lactis]|uniref:hypothetical protein n=1 Tax=Lactococcus lactis TaxID=1358 RepID=UPI0038780625
MNKAEKLRAYELNDMVGKITPLTGMGGKTQTTLEIGKSWIAHEPLLQYLKTALDANVWLSINSKSQGTIEFYSERYNTAVEEFYECLAETFSGESNKRPAVDWL